MIFYFSKKSDDHRRLALLFQFLDEVSRGKGRVIFEPKTMTTSSTWRIQWTKCFTSFIRKVWSAAVAAAKDLGTQSTLLKTLGNLWNDNNNIDLFYLCPRESRTAQEDNSSKTKTFTPLVRQRRQVFRILGLFLFFIFKEYLRRLQSFRCAMLRPFLVHSEKGIIQRHHISKVSSFILINRSV